MYGHDGKLIDECIVIYFQAPHSFSGEDIVEFQCHGGVVVAQLILQEVLRHGVVLAQAGEFSKRAFLNGRIDLSEAEAIAKLIETKSVDAAKILSAQMKGAVKEFVVKVRDSLVEILAFVEVNIDYAEEDLPADLILQIEQKLQSLRAELLQTYESSKQRSGLINGFKIAIVGKPNVGKSSLLNALLHYERAIISDIAGTTRDTIEEEIRIGTHLIKIIDTAGIREAGDSIEKIGIERSKLAIEESDIVVSLFDSSREFDHEDASIYAMLQAYKDSKEILYILNKCDLPSRFEKLHVKEKMLELSCKNQSNILVKELEKLLDKNAQDDTILLTSTRQLEAVKKSYENIEQSVELLSEGELELFAFHINEAIMSIASISTNFQRDEILDKMFGSFCLGK